MARIPKRVPRRIPKSIKRKTYKLKVPKAMFAEGMRKISPIGKLMTVKTGVKKKAKKK